MKTYKMHKRVLAFGLAVAMIFSGLRYSDKQVEAAEPDVKFGVISDTHLTEAESDWKRQETLTRALTYYKEQGVSLIAVNADIVDLGEDAAYTKFNTIWNEVFTDTATAPKLLVTADNHEYYKAWVMSGQTAKETVAEAQTRFKTAFGLDSIHNVVQDSGYYFIGVSSDAATDDSGHQKSGVAYYSTETLEWLKGQLDAAKSSGATKPIYLFIHQPAEGTVPNGEAIPENLKSLLSNYPQIVLFTSHTHLPLEDERQIYQEDYTIVNTSAIYERQQGLIVSTTGTSTEIQRCDFSGDTVKQIKECYFLYHGADKGWEQLRNLDDYLTANELTVTDATVKMGGDYGDGAYYDLKATFTGNNWLVNETVAPGTDITFQYTINSEKRETGGMFGLFRAEANSGLVNYKYGLMNYLTSGTTTYSPTDGTVTFVYDYSEHKPIPFQSRVYTGGFTSKKGTAYTAASNATDMSSNMEYLLMHTMHSMRTIPLQPVSKI